MTTTARPAPGQPRGTTHRVLLGAGAATVVPVAVLAVIGALVVGSPAGWGAVVGGGLSLVLLFAGALMVASATAVSPQTSLVVAMTTFVTVVVVAAAGFYLLEVTGFVGEVVATRWVAGGVAVAGVSWSLAHLVGHSRSRILAFDLAPEPRSSAADQTLPVSDESAAGATEVRVP